MKPRITQLDMFGPKTEEWELHWKGMPEFDQQDLAPVASNTYEFPDGRLYVHFELIEDQVAFGKRLGDALRAHPGRRPEELGREWFSKVVEQDLTRGLAGDDRKRTQSVWWPEAEIGRFAGKAYVNSGPETNPRHPVYIISKGRADTRYTSKALEALRVPYRIVVEPQEAEAYRAVISPDKVLVLPFSNLGQGSIPARNWVWEHSIAEGAERHWIMDDNIQGFYRLNRNLKVPVGDGTIFRAAEEFAGRYENVAEFGFHYFMFASRKSKLPPYYPNSRVYSCICLRNDLPHRWRGRYNEDTDLSIRLLKDGYATILFSAFLAFKSTTMTMKGGNTDELYAGTERAIRAWETHAKGCSYCDAERPWDCAEARVLLEPDGRWRMALSLREQHPEITKITRKWGRWQHSVDYSGFKKTKLRLREGVVLPADVNDFGMALQVGSPERPAPSEQTSPPRTVTVTTRADLEIKPARTVHVHFESEEDVQAFAALVDQRLTSETRTCWWPKMELK
jgi:hypothetical protein